METTCRRHGNAFHWETITRLENETHTRRERLAVELVVTETSHTKVKISCPSLPPKRSPWILLSEANVCGGKQIFLAYRESLLCRSFMFVVRAKFNKW